MIENEILYAFCYNIDFDNFNAPARFGGKKP